MSMEEQLKRIADLLELVLAQIQELRELLEASVGDDADKED